MNRRNILVLILILAGATLYYGYKLYNKPVAKVSDLKSEFVLTAKDFCSEFDADEDAATKKYLEKVIELTGIIDTISKNETGATIITLSGEGSMSSVACEMDSSNERTASLLKGQSVTLRGICSGKLLDVVLNRCTLK